MLFTITFSRNDRWNLMKIMTAGTIPLSLELPEQLMLTRLALRKLRRTGGLEYEAHLYLRRKIDPRSVFKYSMVFATESENKQLNM